MRWQLLVDTSAPSGLIEDGAHYREGETFRLKGRSLALFVNRGATREETPEQAIGVIDPAEPQPVAPPVVALMAEAAEPPGGADDAG
jgi:hypothetical protein